MEPLRTKERTNPMLNSHIIDSIKLGSRYYVTGNTYPRRAELKAAGFRWDPEQKAWWTTSAKEANRVVDALLAEHRENEARREAAEQKAHEGYRWTWRSEQWRDDTGKWAVWHDMDDNDDMYDGISGFSGGWFGWEKIEKPVETRKISIAKIAQAAAAHLAQSEMVARAAEAVAKAAEPATIAVSLRPIVAAAAAAAAHAVRSARAKKAWETRRRNAARQAEALAATCEPLVTDGDALPASVAYSATPSAELCPGRAAHGVDGRVVADYIGGPLGEWSHIRHDYLHMAHTDNQYCETRGRRNTSGTVRPVWAPGSYFPASCVTMDEARRARRRARDAAWHREHRKMCVSSAPVTPTGSA